MTRFVALAFCVVAFALRALDAAENPARLAAPDPARGVIGLAVRVIPPARLGSFPVDAVFIVRVFENTDRFDADHLIRSTITTDGSAYVLNVEPGRYVAVGCTFNPEPSNVDAEPPAPDTPGEGVVVFSEADIVMTEVDVRAGAVVFIGKIDVSSTTKTKGADRAQSHYLSLIAPKGAKQGFMARAFTGHLVYNGSFKHIEKSEAAEARFWGEAIDTLFKGDAGWTDRIARRSIAPAGAVASSAPPGAPLSSDEFLSRVCITVNTAKARASGRAEEAASIARAACGTAMANWASHGCREKPDQDRCTRRLASWDDQLKESGSSLLFTAAQAGQVSICEIMIAMGRDPNAPVANGATPLSIASERPYPEIVALFSKAAALAPAPSRPAAAVAEEPDEARAAMKAGDYATALRLLTPRADGGEPGAQNMLGVLELEGWGVDRDYAKALANFRKSAEQRDAKGAYNLGRMYDNGWGVTKDLSEAAKWYRISADKGYPLGQSILGAMYATGDGVAQDYAQAMTWYSLAADQGEPEAQRRLGLMYADGQGVTRDDAQAFSWYLKSANQGNLGGEYWVGRFYLEGRGIEKNVELARTWLDKAAGDGSPDALKLLSESLKPAP